MDYIWLNFDEYYINQGDPGFADIRFKNNTTIKSYGCGVCCAAMIVCKTLDLTQTGDKQAVIKKVIADATNADGLLTYSNVTYDGVVFKFIKNTDYMTSFDLCQPSICKLNGHFVLVNGFDSNQNAYEAYLIKDPGASANRNLQQPMQKYGSAIKDTIALRYA